jgi:L-2-hydroxyglutarate oxidase LhgO
MIAHTDVMRNPFPPANGRCTLENHGHSYSTSARNASSILRKCYGFSSESSPALILDAVVIGAGVVGLAVARELARRGWEPLVIEKASRFGMETSSRNSEVIHAGIYYPPGSLKAISCRRGRDLLYDYCARANVPHRKLGKLIIARHGGQIAELERIARLAAANGVSDLQFISGGAAAALEPELKCIAALLSPSTGIVDSHALMVALLGEAEAAGARLVLQTSVERLSIEAEGWGVHVVGEAGPAVVTRRLVNCAGLHAHRLAAATDGLDPKFVPQVWYAKGSYFTYSGKQPFRHLIYPVPEPGGLGTHLTLDLASTARFGPDVQWIADIDYAVDADRRPAFVAAAKQIWAAIDGDKLEPGYAGIRPKLSRDGSIADFVLAGPGQHGCAGLVNLFGIESPGLTASLAIAERVGEML